MLAHTGAVEVVKFVSKFIVYFPAVEETKFINGCDAVAQLFSRYRFAPVYGPDMVCPYVPHPTICNPAEFEPLVYQLSLNSAPDAIVAAHVMLTHVCATVAPHKFTSNHTTAFVCVVFTTIF